jgi:hypothetical protein
MMQGSAPACYQPLLAALVQAQGLPQGIRLLALQALGRLSLLCDQVAQQHGGIITAVASSGADGTAVREGAQLQQAALQLASSLVLQSPNSNLHMMAALEAQLEQPSGGASGAAAAAQAGGVGAGGGGAGVAATTAGLYGHVILCDRLQLSPQVFEVLAGCLEHSEPLVRRIACEVRGLIGHRRHIQPASAASRALLSRQTVFLPASLGLTCLRGLTCL